MSTLADIAEAVWTHPERTLADGDSGTPTVYPGWIAGAVWEFAERSAESVLMVANDFAWELEV